MSVPLLPIIYTLSQPARQLPLFNPDPTAVPGLELLAAAAASSEVLATKGNTTLSLHSTPGPFNPAASLPIKVVRKILELEFVEMSEVTIDDDVATGPGLPSPPVPES